MSDPMFMSCGDCLFDLFDRTQPAAGPASVELGGRVGGSPLNVALGLARLGHPTGFLAKVSNDLFGRRIRAFLQAERIDTRWLVETDRNTTLAVVSLSPEGTPTYSFFIEGTADRSLMPEDLPARLPESLGALHLGSYCTVAEPTGATLAALVEREAGRRFVSYDPNVRSSVVPDLDRWRERVATLLPMVSMIKASEEDLTELYPGRSVEAVLSEWAGAGPDLAVVTRGENGALAAPAGGDLLSVPGLAVQVADTVGAGDTFQAALLAGTAEFGLLRPRALRELSRGGLQELLSLAVRAAAVTCSRRGADLPTRADLGLPAL